MADDRRSWDDRLSIARSFNQVDSQAISALIEILETDDSMSTGDRFKHPFYVNKSLAVEALWAIDPLNDDFLQVMAKMLRDEESRKRSFAALHIGGLNNTDAFLPALIDMLANDEPEERVCAAIALGRIGSEAEQAIPHLLGLLAHDSNPDVRSFSASALGEIQPGNPKVVAALTGALNDEHKRVRDFSQEALKKILSEAVPTKSPYEY